MKIPYRTGIGYDVHRIAKGRKLILGGVEIDADFGLAGHSDADVLSHAIADAILGAAGLADIGHYFPPSDASLKNLDSQVIVKTARKEAGKQGYVLLNVDAVIIAEAPRILPYRDQMKAILSRSLEIDSSRIGIKATTNEGLGWIGRGEGMAAHAVCMLALA